ncbi:YggT family protein [Chloroflexota bacterium]
MTYLLSFLKLLCDVLVIIILIRIVVSWVSPGQTNTLTNILYQVTEPILGPIRRILPRTGIFDLSPMVAVVLLQGMAFLFYYLQG